MSITASGLGFAGGGDGLLRAFALKTGKVLWTFNTTRPIAAGPTIFSAGGKEYVAVTVGGTPTSSNGGVASWLQVFALPGARSTRATSSARAAEHPVTTIGTPAAPRAAAAARASGAARIVLHGCVRSAGALAGVQLERSNRQRTAAAPRQAGRRRTRWESIVTHLPADGRCQRRGSPSRRQDAAATASRWSFRRLPRARRRKALTNAQQSAVRAASVGGISVAYRIVDLQARPQKNGDVAVNGPRRSRRRRSGTTSRLAQLSACGNGHRRVAASLCRGATVVTRTTGPRLLDLLVAVERQRPLRVVLRCPPTSRGVTPCS